MPEDGYQWKKYGQKFIKNIQKFRSYFRCRHKLCGAKKKVEWHPSDTGGDLRIVYEGAPAVGIRWPAGEQRRRQPVRAGRPVLRRGAIALMTCSIGMQRDPPSRRVHQVPVDALRRCKMMFTTRRDDVINAVDLYYVVRYQHEMISALLVTWINCTALL